jgi:hypothetical protein
LKKENIYTGHKGLSATGMADEKRARKPIVTLLFGTVRNQQNYLGPACHLYKPKQINSQKTYILKSVATPTVQLRLVNRPVQPAGEAGAVEQLRRPPGGDSYQTAHGLLLPGTAGDHHLDEVPFVVFRYISLFYLQSLCNRFGASAGDIATFWFGFIFGVLGAPVGLFQHQFVGATVWYILVRQFSLSARVLGASGWCFSWCPSNPSV